MTEQTDAPDGFEAAGDADAAWQAEVCKACGRDNIVGFRVSDSVWRDVMGDEQGVLCIFCFDGRATIQNIAWDRDPVEFFAVSHIHALTMASDDHPADAATRHAQARVDALERVAAEQNAVLLSIVNKYSGEERIAMMDALTNYALVQRGERPNVNLAAALAPDREGGA